MPDAYALNDDRDSALLETDATADPFQALYLELKVCDPETIAALTTLPDGPLRDEFALSALRIGVLALRQARGQLDAGTIGRECERMLGMLHTKLQEHGTHVHERITNYLKEYFDPDTGRFHERVDRLVSRDGELEQLLRRQIGQQDSELCKTLAAHFGQESPLMRVLSPSQSEGLLAALADTLKRQLDAQREAVLRQFSLDNQDGALARFIAQLTDNQGRLGEKLQGKIDEVRKEFSLNDENSALSRLVRNVDRAQRTISSEFSLDNEGSALSKLKNMLDSTNRTIEGNLTLDDEASSLSRLKRELLTILDGHSKTNREFQEQVKVALATLVAKREEAARSTRHGDAFEDVLVDFCQRLAQQSGDLAEATGRTTGQIKNCKIGDCVLSLGPESAAPGARIVVEAKEKKEYDLRAALAELEQARKNRDAQVGLFVFSKTTAPANMDPLGRYGQDVVVVWDAADPCSDLFLKTALSLAKALCIRAAVQSQAQAADFSAIDEAVLEVARRAAHMEDIGKSAETIRSASDKILDRTRIIRDALERQVQVLHARLADLKDSLAGSSS